jgi:hypothetical protein
MRNSDFQRFLALTFALAASSAGAADVSMKGDAKLTGEIAGMDAEGSITLVSPVSEKPLLLMGDRVEKVEFGTAEAPPVLPDQRLELTNGDILPVSLNSMENGLLRVESPVLGTLAIPREAVSTLQLGIIPEKTIYPGPEDFSGWDRSEDGARTWELERDAFVAKGPGKISRDVALPEKFIIRFTLAWRNHPNFQFCFAEDAKGGADRYLMEFGGSGLTVSRESPKRARTPIVLLGRNPEEFARKRMDVEIRGDRSRGLLELRINGELEGRYTDPIQPIPRGTGISFVSRAARASGQTVGDIRILEWDDRGDRHRSEERGDGRSDSLIGRYGERFGGSLEGIRSEAGAKVYLFKSDFQKEPLELPEEEVSTVFLMAVAKPSKSGGAGGHMLNLRGHGSVRVSSCVLDGDSVKVEHPLLGSLEFDRSGIASIQRIPAPKAEPVKNR